MSAVALILSTLAGFALFSKRDAGANAPGVGPLPGGTTKQGFVAGASQSGEGDGAAWVATLPPKGLPERDAAILAALKSGMGNFGWSTIKSSIPGYEASITVMNRVVRVGQKNPVRVDVNYDTAQKLCDLYSSAMMTPKIADLTRKQCAVPLVMQGRNEWVQDGTMGDTKRMIEYNTQLDKLVSTTETGLITNEGKHWIICQRLWNDPEKGWNFQKVDKWSANYGWWSKGAPNGVLWQTPGLKHNWLHVDYSQSVMLVFQWMSVNGVMCHIGSVLKDPKLSALVSDEGPLQSWAHPAYGLTSPSLPPIPPLTGA